MLIVNADATWSCHIGVRGRRRQNSFGYTFASLLNFLAIEFAEVEAR